MKTPRFRVKLSSLLPQAGDQFPNDFELLYPSSGKQPVDNSVLFFKSALKNIEEISRLKNCLIIIPRDIRGQFLALGSRNYLLETDTPRLEFAKILTRCMSVVREERTYTTHANGVTLGQNVTLGEGSILEPGVFVDHDVAIGSGTKILSGSRIRRFTVIGNDCVIRENSVIGGWGFGFERDENGIPIRLPHLGGVTIGNRVEIGALNTVVSGTVDATSIDDDVKTDDHVHIAHNCIIHSGVLITACCELSGSVEVGASAWLGPNAAIMNGIKIGENAVIGLGAVVTKPVAPGMTVAGSPAEPTNKIRSNKEALAMLHKAIENGKF